MLLLIAQRPGASTAVVLTSQCTAGPTYRQLLLSMLQHHAELTQHEQGSQRLRRDADGLGQGTPVRGQRCRDLHGLCMRQAACPSARQGCGVCWHTQALLILMAILLPEANVLLAQPARAALHQTWRSGAVRHLWHLQPVSCIEPGESRSRSAMPWNVRHNNMSRCLL